MEAYKTFLLLAGRIAGVVLCIWGTVGFAITIGQSIALAGAGGRSIEAVLFGAALSNAILAGAGVVLFRRAPWLVRLIVEGHVVRTPPPPQP